MKFIRTLTVAALFAALFVLALPVHADCGDGDPTCILEPPISVEIRTDSSSGDASVTVAESGALTPLDFAVPMPLPRRVEAPLVSAHSEPKSTDSIPDFTSLSIPMRYQAAGDVSCGVQALGMALDPLEGHAPTSPALLDHLNSKGYLYDFGTGAEELALAAQAFGFEGSVAFHGWMLEDLRSELDSGRPVVIDLGANGLEQPGHFVTLTGISDDWQWVAYSDPTLGERVVPLAEFMRLWDLQGRSGVAVATAPPPASSPDFAPWTALAAAMMATLALGPGVLQDLRRSGTGGNIDAGTPTSHLTKPDDRPRDPPPPRSPILVKVPHVETVVVKEVVIGGHWEERKKFVEPRWETVSPGHWEWRDRRVAYTAYRPKSVVVEKVVNVAREVTEKVTTWVTKNVVKPVTQWVKKTVWKPVVKWVKQTKTWFQRTWLGKWLRKAKTWFEKKVKWVRKTVLEPVKRWVTEKVVKPVTTFVKRTIVEPVKKLVTKTILEPYTAYRTEKVEVWAPPVKTYIPGHYETKRTWVEETIPITQEVTRWEDVLVDPGVLPDSVAQDFFQRVDPSLSYEEQIALFHRFSDMFGALITSDPDKANELSEMAFDIFFSSVSGAENESAMQAWMMVNTFALSLRSEAGSSSTVMEYIPYGAYLHWTSESEQIGDTTWYKVQYLRDGELVEGWVSGAYLTDYVPGSSQVLLDVQMDKIFERYGIQVQGTWNLRDKRAAALAIERVAEAFSRELGIDGEQAFKKIFDSITLLWGVEPESGYLTPQCKGIDAGGCTSSAHMINFGSLWAEGPYRPETVAFQGSVNNVVHELGHAFANLWWGSEEGPYADLGLSINGELLSNFGFQEGVLGADNLWRQHPELKSTPNEVFADMFLGWVYDEWLDEESGRQRQEYMGDHMPAWIEDAISDE